MSESKKPVDRVQLKSLDDDHVSFTDKRTLSSRERIRNQLSDDVDEFLSQGGHIEQVESHVTGDPPTKPVSKYGGRPI
jgi:hypothetical protein